MIEPSGCVVSVFCQARFVRGSRCEVSAHRADACELRARQAQGDAVTQRLRQHEWRAGLAHDPFELVGLVERLSERLLQEHRLAALEGESRERQVRGRRCHDDHRAQSWLLQQLRRIGVVRDAELAPDAFGMMGIPTADSRQGHTRDIARGQDVAHPVDAETDDADAQQEDSAVFARLIVRRSCGPGEGRSGGPSMFRFYSMPVGPAPGRARSLHVDE
jgi:hypothetical protein